MIRVLHLFDATAGWEHRFAVERLLERLPASDVEQGVAVVDAAARVRLGFESFRCPLFARRFAVGFLHAAPALRRHLERHRIDILHAWGVQAAIVAEMAVPDGSVLVAVTLLDPSVALRNAHFLRTAREPRREPIVCASGTVRQWFVEQGIDSARCVVIRPGVDFSVIHQARSSDLRRRLGLNDRQTLVVTPEPVTPTGGHFAAFWMTAIRSFLEPDIRVALPGESREQRRLLRLARQIGMDHLVVSPPGEVRFEQLVAIADLAVAVPTEEMSGAALAWAMAAGVPILGTAVYSIAEMIVHDVNGLLFNPASAKQLATHLARALDDRDGLRRLAEVARGQAYQVFGLRRCIDQHRRLYDNLTSGRSPGDGITDSAGTVVRQVC